MTPRVVTVITETWPSDVNPISGVYVAEQASAFARICPSVNVMVVLPFGRRQRALSLGEQGLAVDGVHTPVCTVRVLRLPLLGPFGYLAVLWNTWRTGRVVGRRLRRQGTVRSSLLVHGGRYAAASLPDLSVASGISTSWLVLHGVDPLLTQEGRSAEWLRRRLQLSQARTTTPVLVGSSLLDYIRRLDLDESAWHVIPNGTFLPAKSSPASAESDGPVKILSVSNLVENKGIDLQLRALAILKERSPRASWVYHIVGDGPQRPELESLSRELGIEERVSFLGRLSREDTLERFDRCDFFALPSWLEAFGIVYLEAMARGKPVIACERVGPIGLVEDRVNGLLVPVQNVERLADALTVLVTNGAFRRRLGDEAALSAEKFSWEHNARSMIDALE